MKSWILYGNFWVSAGAAALACTTCLLHQIPVNPEIILLVFFSSLFIYNYHRVFRSAQIYGDKASERHRWILANKKAITTIALLSSVIVMALGWLILNRFILVSALPFFLIAVLYVVPLLKIRGRRLRLRDVPYLKVFLIALVWSYATVILPLSGQGAKLFADTGFWFTFFQRLLFILAITLPFDARDREHDIQHQLDTFATVWGVFRLKQTCHFLLILMLVMVFSGMQTGIYQPEHAAGLLISALGTAWLIGRLREQNSEFYFTALLDGTMIDQLFWVWLMGILF